MTKMTASVLSRPSDRSLRVARLATGPIRWLMAPVFYGVDNIPAERPLMFVSNHMVYGVFEVLLLATELYERTGILLRGMGDHAHFQIPVWGSVASAYGVIDGTPENCARLLETGECPLVFPGGAREAAKRRGERYNLEWGNRFGFARLATRFGCTIIPVSGIGVDDAFQIWRDRDDFAARFGGLLDRLEIRREMLWPIANRFHPERLYFRIGEPIHAPVGGDSQAICSQVHAAVAGGIEWLLRERDRDPDRYMVPRIRHRAELAIRQARVVANVFAQQRRRRAFDHNV
jgi:1-acyl-sn-glycerol-3-phosphate acyltransferase